MKKIILFGMCIFLLLILANIAVSSDLSDICAVTKNRITFEGVPTYFAVGDLNNDGYNDLAMASISDNAFVFWNTGYGAFSNWTYIDNDGLAKTGIDIGDVDNDGDLDIAYAGDVSGSDDVLKWAENTGSKEFTIRVISEDTSLNMVKFIDFNNDGLLDIAVGKSVAGTFDIGLWKQLLNGSFEEASIIDTDIGIHFDIGDVDRDGDDDIFGCYNAKTPKWLENDGSGVFNERVISSTPVTICTDSLKMYDIDKKNGNDFLMADYGKNRTIWFRNKGNNEFRMINLTDEFGEIHKFNQSYSVAALDFDNDGDLDIINSILGDREIRAFINVNNAFDNYYLIGDDDVNLNMEYMTMAADMNNDNFNDYLVSQSVSGQNYVFYYNLKDCQLGIYAGYSSQICPEAHSIFCDDFNYDIPYDLANDWTILTNQWVNITMAPVSNEMYMPDDVLFDAIHDLPATPVHYTPNENIIVRKSDKYPVVTSEFTINKTENSGILYYTIQDRTLKSSVSIRIFNNTVQRQCSNYSCWINAYNSSVNITSVKLVQFLGQDTLDYINSINPDRIVFNVTEENSNYDLYINNILAEEDMPYTDVESFEIHRLVISKDYADTFAIDNLYIYRGFSKDTNTEEPYIVQILDNATAYYTDYLNATERDKDWAADLEKGIVDIGIISVGSRLMFALLVMIVSLVVVATQLGKVGVSGGAIAVISFIVVFMEIFFFVYLGLIPVWIVFLLFLAGAGASFMLVRNMGGE